MSFFTIPLKIITSGSQRKLGQEVTSEVKIEPTSELKPENVSSEISAISLYYDEGNTLILKATLNSDMKDEKVLDFVADFSDHLTFLINSKEENPWNGTFFVEPQVQNIHFQNSTSLSINDNPL